MRRYLAGLLQLTVPALAASLFLSSGTALAQQQAAPSERVQTAVNVRAAPTTESAVLDRLEPGETLRVEGDLPGWHRVLLPNGSTGYVSKAWTVVADLSAAGAVRVHAIDVGTGLAIFVEAPDFTLLYDAGSNDDTARGERNRVVAYLRNAKPALRTIDHVILSHPHKDHVELLPDIFDAYDVRHVWDSGRLHPICGYRGFLSRIAAEAAVNYHDAHTQGGAHVAAFPAATCYGRPEPARNVTIAHASPIQVGRPVALGQGSNIVFLHADADAHHSPNENSLVARLDLPGGRILFMGDAEAGGRDDPSVPPRSDSIEGRLLSCCSRDLRVDVLVVGHHGSKTSSRTQFLNAVGARVFIVSAGPTRYGSVTLPDAEVVRELDARGDVWRTDIDDGACRANVGKIGPDNDNNPGGCDNIRVSVPGSGRIAVTYHRVAD